MPGMRAVIGLEIHARLRTQSKMFCGCANRYGAAPNSLTCPVCLGLPGALPVPNRRAVTLGIRFALAVGAEIHTTSVFARKNYFYPDLPKGYQITQYDRPLATGGLVRIEPPGAGSRWIGLRRAHLEEDAGKSVHEGLPDSDTRTGIDLNRCGVPLLEIVSEPELGSPEEARLLLERLRTILRDTGICDGNMERGSLRVDANVSLRRGQEPPGTRVELKNLNSLRGLRRALRHEIARQTGLLEAGGQVARETRLWDEAAACTRSMRGKEEVHDYRYFPEPDLPPLVLEPGWLERELDHLPEPPHARYDRLVAELGLRAEDARRLTLDGRLADYYELVARASANARASAAWVLTELRGRLNREGIGIESCPLDPERLAALVRLVDEGTVSVRAAREVFEDIYASGADPEEIVSARGLRQLTDENAIREAARRVLVDHPVQVEQFRAGKRTLLAFFIGETIDRTAGKASPHVVRRVLETLLTTPPDP